MKRRCLLILVFAILFITMATVFAASSIKVQCYSNNTLVTANTINLNIKLVNNGSEAIPLSAVKFRYYFTNDGTQSNSFACDWASAGNANVNASFANIAAVSGADRYCEIGFSDGAGTLAVGANLFLAARIWKNDWSNFTQTNDYSFNASANTYVDCQAIAGYIGGKLSWGISPSGGGTISPTPTSTATPVVSITPSPTPAPTSIGNPTVYICGDSTVMTYSASYAPQAGWGQFIASYFKSNVKFVNKAIGGRSSKSFVVEGRLDEILSVIKPNDYLFVQFGHNDATISKPERYAAPYTTYKEYLKKYIKGAREHNAIPVLITPVGRLNYVNDAFKNDFPDYCIAMKQVAAEEGVKLIDLMTKSLDYYTSVGYNEAYTLFLVSVNGTDYTHFTEKGANQIARLVAQGVAEINIPIAQYLK